jgi:DNA-binding transcriptional LysR family regulator
MADLFRYLDSIVAVLSVARKGSFRAAMRDDRVAYRWLQDKISDLEAHLGFLIFRRTRNGLVLTDEGQSVIEHAEQIEETLRRMLKLKDAFAFDRERDVHVSVTEGLGTFWVAPRLAEFRRLHPLTRIQLDPSMAVPDMRQLETDISVQIVEPTVSNIRRLRVGHLHLMLAAAPSYLDRYGRPETVGELAFHQFVFQQNAQISDRRVIEKALGRPLTDSQCMVLQNSSSHYMTIERGGGIGFVPTYGFAVGAKVEPVNLPITMDCDIWLCGQSDARAMSQVATVLDWLISIFDPRLFPWFRRQFVPPAEFPAIIDALKLGDALLPYSFSRKSVSLDGT